MIPEPPGSEGRQELAECEQQAAGLVSIVARATRIVRVLSQELNPELFDNKALVSELSRVARLGRQCEVRILVQSTHLLVKRRHRMAALHARLLSSVPIRTLPHMPEHVTADYVLADDSGVFWMPRAADRVCFMNAFDRPRVKQLTEQFDELWFRAQPDPELRVMPL